MTKAKLLLETSTGEQVPVTSEGLQVIFDSLKEETNIELGTKMMVSLCLHGLESDITQSIGKKLMGRVKEL